VPSLISAVIFDVDFTIARPGKTLGPLGYAELGKQFGLQLDPMKHDDARAAALAEFDRHPELDHDEERWIDFTERIIREMGGANEGSRACAVAMSEAWRESKNFEIYDDVRPALLTLRDHGLRLGLLSNTGRNLEDFCVHHALDIDAGISSFHHGKTKPHASIFRAVLALLEVEPEEAAMVGDTVEDDIEGALALGMRAVLVDRLGSNAGYEPRIADLYALPAALGIRTL
jgi:HAD superfamily hydrolase (TIGR01549 family)